MNSLFWKIFISFWLSLVLFASLTLWSTSRYIETVRAQSPQYPPRHNIGRYLDQAEHIAEHQGIDELRDWLEQLDKREAVPYLLLDENGNDLIGRPVPLRLQQRIKRYEQRLHHDEHEYGYRRSYQRTININNHRYRLIADFQSITLGRVLNRPRVIAIPILIALLISGIVCFLLARYLTSPIARLRKATQQMALGDLSQRVTPSMGKRKDEIVELANDFDHMAEQLQALISSHKQLLRDASHELRSPLARLQVALGLARQRSTTESDTEFDRIEREAERLNELIGQLLSLARMETGHLELQHESIDLDKLITDIANDAAYEARASNRDVHIINTVPVRIKGSTTLIHSALENVIRNAIRYTDENTSVEISLAKDTAQPDQAIIKIRDHGPGIPEEMLDRIFEPFVRIGEARDRSTGGYGLGLAIARRAILLHGGKMTAHNAPDKGMTVSILLPIKKGR